MNKYQRLVVIVAAINVLLMLLFPPFNGRSLARLALETFDGYYFILSVLGEKEIHSTLLTMQLMLVGVNALAAWLLLQTKKHHEDIPSFRHAEAIGAFVAVNLAVIFLFPPFEPYQSLQKHVTATFDSFYFVFGDRSKRPFYVPLLQLEIMWVSINAMALWLLFNAVKRNDDAAHARIVALAEALPDEEVEEIAAEIRHRIEERHAHEKPALGRGGDRRHAPGSSYRGQERRSGHDRRDER